jgi:uncharacterized protein (TIGR02001 family)
MKRSLLALAAVTALTAIPSAAFADLAFNVGATSDYRYRGISQTRLKPALQAGVDFSAGGFFAWAHGLRTSSGSKTLAATPRWKSTCTAASRASWSRTA